ncbi:MAG: NYN domain-containing protein [Parcubacteria group bacterium]|nr:NYN domain-containing protein [Parcubacteria group bacterium]
MFIPKTERIDALTKLFPKTIADLEDIFDAPTNIYIDWQNVIHQQDRWGWHIQAKRLKQLFDSFDTIQGVYLYTGTLDRHEKARKGLEEIKQLGYKLITKPVKIMPYSIRTSSVSPNSPDLLAPFIKKALLSVLDIQTIEYLNNQLAKLNKQGVFELEDKKCNFDVEIGRDIFLDLERGSAGCFVLWSGDSDFVDPLTAVIGNGKKAVLFATSGGVSSELSALNLPIFEIKKIKEFICWSREVPQSIKDKIANP